MNLQCSKIILLILITIHLISCDATKRVPENQHLLNTNTIFINGKKDKSELINNLLYQEPNSRIPVLGTPLRLHVYNLARNNKDSLFEVWLDKTPKRRERLTNRLSEKQLVRLKERSIGFNNWLKKTGEAPVLVSEDRSEKSVERLEAYYTNSGWFDVEANYNITKNDNKRADVTYQVKTGVSFVLDTIIEKISSPVIDSLYQNIKKNTLIKQNEPYKTSNFSEERERISYELRNSGIFHFNQDYVTFEMDTIGTNKKVNVEVQIQNRAVRVQDSVTRVPFSIYKIKDVNIITDYSFENRKKAFQDSIIYNGYKIYGYNKIKYRPKALTDAVFITPNSIFKDSDRTLTYRHLNELRTFKYPNIDYIENADNTLTDTIRLTPLKKFNLGFSADVTQSNIQTIGFSLNPSLMIRNLFRGAETLEISVIGAIGASQDKELNDPFFDINEIGADLKLTIPRFFFPFNTEKIIPKYMSPSTKISLATTSQTNIGLDKQTFTGVFNYNWQPSKKVTNRLDVFNIQYVRNLNIENYFGVYKNSLQSLNSIARSINYIDSESNLDPPGDTDAFLSYVLGSPTPSEISSAELTSVNSINERKNRLTENNLILASSFSLTHDSRSNLFDNDFSIFKFKLELAGNVLSSLSDAIGLQKNASDKYELFNVAYSQYIKPEFDYVKYWSLGNQNVLATRSYIGVAIPFGNSTNIPFSKSFFAGGANDNRAWTAYRLGPGSSESSDEYNDANLKLALSIEQRFNFFGKINGAFFIDAGNIWNVFDDVTDENATFSNLSSLKDIAIGTGFGLRYDFSFFVFRFDVGFKTYDPSYQNENRWFNDYNFSNAVYNIGINYPF